MKVNNHTRNVLVMFCSKKNFSSFHCTSKANLGNIHRFRNWQQGDSYTLHTVAILSKINKLIQTFSMVAKVWCSIILLQADFCLFINWRKKNSYQFKPNYIHVCWRISFLYSGMNNNFIRKYFIPKEKNLL